MLKRHERLKSNSHDDSVNGQSGLVNELKPIKTEPTPVDTVEKNGDGDVVTPLGCVSGQTEDHKVLKILRNYAVNRGFCSKEQSLQGKTESFLLGFIKQSEKLPSSKKPDRSAGLEATVDLARHRRSNESQSRYLTSAPDDEIASGSSDDGTVAPVTSNFAKNIVNGFGQFLQFVNDLEEPQVSMKSIEEAKKLLAPLLIWITFDLLENGYKLEAQNLLTTYISQVNEGVKNRKNLEEIEEITQEILEVLEDVTLDGEKLRVAFRRLLKLKLSDSLFVAISAECRDLITAYLRNMRNPMLMLQTFNAFVTVDEAAPMHSGENLLSETEEEEEIEMVGGNSVEMKVTPSAAEKSEELPKSVKKRKRIPTIEPEKKKRGSEDVIPTPSQANIGMKSNLLMQSTFESRVDEKNDMAVAGLDDLDHLPPILPTRVHRFHLSGTNSEGYNRACISANGQIVGVACDNGTLEVWSSQKRNSYGSSRLYASGSHLSSLNCPTAFSSLKASLSRDLIEEPVILKGHSGPVHSVQFLYDPNTPLEAFGNPTHLISTGNDGTARLFDVSRRQNICAYVASSNSSCVWDVDTFGLEYFVTGGLDQTCRVFQSERLYPLRILAGHTDSVDCVKFHNTGKYIASAGSDGTARFWAVNEAKVARQFHGGSQATNFFCGTPMSLAFSSDGRKLAVAHGIAETVSVWDIGEQRLLQVIAKGFGGSVVEVAFICGDSILVTGSQDGVVRLWDLNKQPSDQSGQTDIPGNRMVSKPTRVFGETEDLTILGLRLVGPNRLVAVYADHTSRK